MDANTASNDPRAPSQRHWELRNKFGYALQARNPSGTIDSVQTQASANLQESWMLVSWSFKKSFKNWPKTRDKP
jgi:hypothetical protein